VCSNGLMLTWEGNPRRTSFLRCVIYFTVRLTLVLRARLPRVPVNVSVNVPWLTFIDANKVTVAEAVPFNMTEPGLIMQVEVGGPPLQLRDTLPARPPLDVNEIV